MTSNQIAWAIRSFMVTASAVATFILAQQDVALEPIVKVSLGALIVAIAALNPTTISDKLGSDA